MALIDDRIAEAETALHKLLTGSLRASIHYADGKAVTFFPTTINQLRAYIQELKMEKAGERPRGAVGIYF